MKLEPFALERRRPVWEGSVAWNPATGDVHPLGLDQLAERWHVR
jgi:hypothetical protein